MRSLCYAEPTSIAGFLLVQTCGVMPADVLNT